MKNVNPRLSILSVSVLLTAFLFLFAAAPSARANIIAQWDEANKTLTITSDADDDIVVSGETTDPDHRGVLINGNMYILPPFGTVDPLVVKRIIINGGPGNNKIDLSAIDRQHFPSLVSMDGLPPQFGVCLDAGGGNDVVVGSQCDDLLIGGDGNDRIEDRLGGIDALYGGSGDDVLNAGPGDDELDGGTGNDEMHGGDGEDKMLAGEGDDLLYGGSGNDKMDGGAGKDHLEGGDQDDEIHGGEGDDMLQGGGEDDLLFGDKGNDILMGGPGDDLVSDNYNNPADSNYLFGEEGNDTMHGGPGNDSMGGGPGNDKLQDYYGNNVIHGDEGDDELNADGMVDGGPGNDIIRGYDGNMHFFEKPGSDDVIDDSANDSTATSLLDFSEAKAGIRIDMDLQNAAQTVDSCGNTVTLIGRIEDFTGSAFADTVLVDPLNVPRTINGGAGSNTLIFDPKGLNVTRTDSTIAVPGYAAVTYFNFAIVRIVETTGLTNEAGRSLPECFNLSQNYPNPFNPSTSIGFSLPVPCRVTVKVYDMMGRDVAMLAERFLTAGTHRLEWNASGFVSGVYFCRIQAGEYTAVRKMVLMK